MNAQSTAGKPPNVSLLYTTFDSNSLWGSQISSSECSPIANFILDGRTERVHTGGMFGKTETQVITPKVSSADLRRVEPLCRLAAPAASPPMPGGRSAGRSEAQLTTSRASSILDLAAAIRLFAGDDLTPQFRSVSSKEEYILCVFSIPSRGSGGRKVGENGHPGYVIPACLSSCS